MRRDTPCRCPCGRSKRSRRHACFSPLISVRTVSGLRLAEFCAILRVKLAEREGFEPSIRFCRILTFQARAVGRAAAAPPRPGGGGAAAPGGAGGRARGGGGARRAAGQ